MAVGQKEVVGSALLLVASVMPVEQAVQEESVPVAEEDFALDLVVLL